MKKTTLISLALATALSTVAMAQSSGFGAGYGSDNQSGFEKRKRGGYGAKNHRRGNSPVSIIYSLDLSDDQKTSLRAIKQSRIDAMGSWESKKAQKIADIKKAFEGNQFNTETYVQNHTNKAMQKAKDHAQDLQQMMAILTTSQKEQFYKKIQELK